MKAQTLLKGKGWSQWMRFTINATESSERVKCDILLVSLALPVEPSLEVGLDMISFKFHGLQCAEQIVWIESIWLNGNLGKHT